MYFLVNFLNSHTRVVYWGNMAKYTPSRAGPTQAFPVLAQLYWEFFFQYCPSSWLWRGSFENWPQGELLMSPLNFLSTRSYITRQRISSSAMSYKGIVYSEYSGATLATHQADKIRQELMSGCIQLEPMWCLNHTVTLHIKFSSLEILSLSREVHLIADTMA